MCHREAVRAIHAAANKRLDKSLSAAPSADSTVSRPLMQSCDGRFGPRFSSVLDDDLSAAWTVAQPEIFRQAARQSVAFLSEL